MSSPAIEVKFADFESFLVDCSTKTCCGRQVSSSLPPPIPLASQERCLPISKLFQEGSLIRKFYFYRQIFFAPLSQFDLHRARALCLDNLAFFVFIWLLEKLGAVFGEVFIDRSDFLCRFLEKCRRKHLASPETSKANLAAGRKEEKLINVEQK